MRVVSLILCMLCASCMGTADSTRRPLPPTLGGITLWEPFEPVRARLGEPRSVDTGEGYYAFGPVYTFKGVVLSAAPGITSRVDVLQIEVTNPEYCTPSGVCPGMKAAEVQRILGRPNLSERVTNGINT